MAWGTIEKKRSLFGCSLFFVELERGSRALWSILGWSGLALPFWLFRAKVRESGAESVQGVSGCLASLVLVLFGAVIFSHFFFK